LILIGSASYSIYIIHTLTLPVFFKVFKLTKIPAADVAADLLTVLCVLFSAGVGILVYLMYEKPVAKLIKHYGTRRPRRYNQGATELTTLP
jgi:exopolysaccharide production protein ExoZ